MAKGDVLVLRRHGPQVGRRRRSSRATSSSARSDGVALMEPETAKFRFELAAVSVWEKSRVKTATEPQRHRAEAASRVWLKKKMPYSPGDFTNH